MHSWQTPARDTGALLADANHSVVADLARLLSRRYPPVTYGAADPGYLPVFVFHSVREDDLAHKLAYLQANGYRTVDLDEAVAWMQGTGRLPPKAVVLTIDDGRRSTWTVAAPLLEKFGMQATAYVVPGYLAAGPVRPTLADVWQGTADRVDVAAAERDDAAQFMRWSEVEALQRAGVVSVQSHSMLHRRVFAGPRLTGFVQPAPAGPPFNVPKDPDDREPWDAQRLRRAAGGPVFEHRPLLGLQKAWTGGRAFQALCRDRIDAEGAAVFFRRRDWRRVLRRLRRQAGGADPQWTDLAAEQWWELEQSKQTLASRLPGRSIRHFCYPNGTGRADLIARVRQAGYASGTWGLLDHRVTNRAGADPHLLSRLKHDFILTLPGDGRRTLPALLEVKLARRLRGEKGY